jgi:hypothetical protein
MDGTVVVRPAPAAKAPPPQVTPSATHADGKAHDGAAAGSLNPAQDADGLVDVGG